MPLLIRPFFKQPTHDHGAFDAARCAVAVKHRRLACRNLEADLSGFLCHSVVRMNKETTSRPGCPKSEHWPAHGTGVLQETFETDMPGLMAAGCEKLKHLPNSGGERCCVIDSCLRAAGLLVLHVWHKQVRPLHLHTGWDSPRFPVLHTLCSAMFVNAQQLSHLRWPAKVFNELRVWLVCIHSRITHHV